MSPFILGLSDHAKLRFKERSITRTQVRRCLAQGEKVRFDIRGRRTCSIRIRTRVLEVVYLDIKGGYLVVTAYWKGE